MRTLNQAVTCPWCRTYYAARPTTTNCMNCGGPLPRGIGADKGEKPELPPRELPKKFVRNVMLWRNTHTLIGVIFIAVGIPAIAAFGFGLIFVGVGYFLYRHGSKVGKEKIEALSNGMAAEGKIIDISKDTTQSINGQHPFIISYTCTTKGGLEQLDKVTCWDDSNMMRNHGDEIWVVYIPENPQISSPWPPMV